MPLTRRALTSCVLFALIACLPSVVRAQTLVWDPNTESNLGGYVVYYGAETGKYTNQANVGNQTQFSPQGFDWTRILYFAVQAYSTDGLKSPLSTEVKWTPASLTRIISVKASTTYPLLAGRTTTWTATATNNLGSALEYQFWLYRKTGWTLAQKYGPGNTFTWTPTLTDVGEPYAVQVWVRTIGSATQYEAWLGTESFAVTGTPFELVADVDFPTPPANQVTWTARFASAPTVPLEYRFMVMNQNSGVWTVFREYATGNQAQWTPDTVGKYAIEAWVRRVGSTAQYESRVTTDFFDVSRTTLAVTGLTVDTVFPTWTGTPITWAARVRGGMSGPIQYQFWLYSARTGWRLAQPYGPSATFTWTPTWADVGDQALQVWVRSNGSTATYESWRASGWFGIQWANLNLTTSTLFPVAPGSNVKWAAEVSDPSADLEYQFLIYSGATAAWTVGRAYGLDNTFTWVPLNTGSFAVQAQARQRGSSAPYEVFRSTDLLPVSQGPAQIKSLTSDVPLPATRGTTITWTAGATGGTAGPLQYQFWRRDGTNWILVQDYSSINTYSWTTTVKDVGQHYLQVWVRSAGSTVAYESYKSSGAFSIQ